jgi:hypothetical protein
MTVRQETQRNNENLSLLEKKVSRTNRPSMSTVHRRGKKNHRNLKQIFILSVDALREVGEDPYNILISHIR